MAHGDYDCCAVCDSKQSYNNNAESKAEICSECVAELARNGVIVGNVTELLQWIASADARVVEDTLKKVGYSKCFYLNTVDQIIDVKIGTKPKFSEPKPKAGDSPSQS